MDDLKPAEGVVATLIGDVVGSRTTPQRDVLHRRLQDALETADQRLRPRVPLRITVGDELQGCFDTVGQALHATLWLPCVLAGTPDLDPVGLRFGVGWGRVGVLQESPRVEDGPGWWAARDAIDAVKAVARRPGQHHLRTSYRPADGVAGPDPAAVEAALLCRDQVVGSLSTRSLRLLGGLLLGRTQVELAEQEGVSASAVSQRVRHDGLAVVLRADELLRSVR